jgi:hypothetical protein
MKPRQSKSLVHDSQSNWYCLPESKIYTIKGRFPYSSQPAHRLTGSVSLLATPPLICFCSRLVKLLTVSLLSRSLPTFTRPFASFFALLFFDLVTIPISSQDCIHLIRRLTKNISDPIHRIGSICVRVGSCDFVDRFCFLWR